MKSIALEVGFKLYVWSTTTGLVDTEKERPARPTTRWSPVGHPGIVRENHHLLRNFTCSLNGDPIPYCCGN